MVLAGLTGWMDRRERRAVAYLMEEIGSFATSCLDSGSSSPIPIDDGLATRGHRLGLPILLTGV